MFRYFHNSLCDRQLAMFPPGGPLARLPCMNAESVEPVAIYRSTSERDCRERLLVLHAVGIPGGVLRAAGDFVVVVAPGHAERAHAELQAYASENVAVPIEPVEEILEPAGFGGTLAFTAALLLVAMLAQREFGGFDWYAAGRTNAGRIQHGEWWRTVTALTLHADWAHLIGNLLVGGVVGWLASRALGSGRAWLLILLAGAAGNLLNALVRSPEHTSVGASTAVFAGIGLLAARTWRSRRWTTNKMQRWAPLIGGVLLLSLLGTGGGRTDVPAHLFGFLCGALSGTAMGFLHVTTPSRTWVQWLMGAVAMALLIASWTIALWSVGRS